jgi:hypothetical protein
MAKKNQTTSLKPDAQAPQPSKPYPSLKSLNKLVGKWKVFGPDIKGRVRFE